MDKALLERYFNGEPCTPDELLQVEAFLKDSSSSESFFYQQWKTAGGHVDPQESEAIWAGVMQGLPAAQQAASAVSSTAGTPVVAIRRRRMPKIITAAVAAIITVIILGIVVFRQTQPLPLAWHTIDNPSQDVKLIRLEDGSQIWLNAHSSLSVSEQYRQRDRQVRLTGEAFFDVAQDAAHPFVVTTGRLHTTVLGTSFDIRAWSAQTPIQVALVSGKVRVSGEKGDSVILSPGDRLDFDTARGLLAIEHNAVRDDRIGWTNGKIVLDNTPLPDILRQLEQIYHVKISNTITNAGVIKLSGQFRREPIGQVLKNLLFPIDLAYTYENGAYIIHQTKDNKSRPGRVGLLKAGEQSQGRTAKG